MIYENENHTALAPTQSDHNPIAAGAVYRLEDERTSIAANNSLVHKPYSATIDNLYSRSVDSIAQKMAMHIVPNNAVPAADPPESVLVQGHHVGGGVVLSSPSPSYPSNPAGIQAQSQALQKFLDDNADKLGSSIFGRPLTDAEKQLFMQTAMNANDGRTMYGREAAGLEALANTSDAQTQQSTLLKQTLIQREGSEATAYLDSEGNLTVGIGHKVTESDGIQLGQTITQDRIDQFYQQDSAHALDTARSESADAVFVTSPWIAALASANFQLGDFPTVFNDSWALLKAGNFDQAVSNIEASKWYQQTQDRAVDLINAIRGVQSLS